MATTVNEFGQVVEVVTAQELIDQQNREFEASGGANDDKGNQNTATSSPTSFYKTDSSPSPTIAVPPNAGTTDAGKSGTPAAATSKNQPGKRLQNPLGNFASYTYQITLYMITPDAYDAFVKSGRRKVNAINSSGIDVKGNGAFIVAQSGGVNSSTGKRPPGMTLDYYIDDLRFTTITSTKESGTATNTQLVTFNIIEPYGFSFISKLRDATNELQKVSKSKNFSQLKDPTRQFFILGVRFQGYDLNGNPMTGKEVFAGDTFDPSGNSDGVFERFWDISITGIKFKLDGKATTYNVTAAALAPGVAFGVKRGIVDKGAKIVAGNVKQALEGNDPDKGVIGLLTKLNNDQLQLVKNNSIEIANKYSIEWLGDAGTIIGDQTIVSKADLDKSKFPMAKSKTTKDSNDALSEKATSDITKRQMTFTKGTPILQAIGLIIAQSSFLEKALKTVYTTSLEPPPDSSAEEKTVNSQTKTIKWYNLSAEVKCLGWDYQISDFAYDIKFLIQPYETPIVVSPFAQTTAKYYGPHKRYDYWYTGKNSEIISYEHSTDNTFTNVVVGQEDVKKGAGTGGAAQIPIKAGGQNAQPTQGKTIPGMETQNSYLTSLFDPNAWAGAKVQILGDPDFLMNESAASSTNESYVYNQFYGTDGYTVNPNGGQVFIEINFQQAVDYDNGTGLMSLNDRILMQPYPPTIAKQVQGVSYMLTKVTSTFSKGKFTQELECKVNTFEGITEDQLTGRDNQFDAETSRLSRLNAAAGTKAPNKTGTSTTGSTGSVQDDVTGLEEAYARQETMNQAAAYDAFYDIGPTDQQTSPTGGSPPIAEIIANSPIAQSSQGATIFTPKAVQDGDASSSNTTGKVEEAGRE